MIGHTEKPTRVTALVHVWQGWRAPRRVTLSLGTGLLVAVLVARAVLPRAVRLLARHASTELYRLTIIAFCLCCGWISGYMVRAGTAAEECMPVLERCMAS